MPDVDFDPNRVDERAHELQIIRLVCRTILLITLAVIGACTYRCDPDARVRKAAAEAEADKNLNRQQGIAEECRRWTP